MKLKVYYQQRSHGTVLAHLWTPSGDRVFSLEIKRYGPGHYGGDLRLFNLQRIYFGCDAPAGPLRPQPASRPGRE